MNLKQILNFAVLSACFITGIIRETPNCSEEGNFYMKRHYSRNVRYICSALAAILILTGCGADQAVSADPVSSGESSA